MGKRTVNVGGGCGCFLMLIGIAVLIKIDRILDIVEKLAAR